MHITNTTNAHYKYYKCTSQILQMHTKRDTLSECLPQAFVYLTDPTLFGCHCHCKPNLRTGRNEVELVDSYFARCIIKVKII